MLISSLLSGVLYFLSFPPFGYWYLIFPALFIFYISILPTKKEKTTNISIGPGVHGFIFGSIAYGVILFGIQSLGLEAWIPLTILMGLMYGFFAKVFSYFGIKTGNNYFVLVGLVSVFDLLRAYFPFGGFPWGYPSTVLVSDLTINFYRAYGPIGFSLVVESLVLLLALLLFTKNNESGLFNLLYLRYFLVFFLIFGFTFFQEITSRENYKDIEISIIQGNSPCPGAKNRCENERQRIYESHLTLTKSLSRERVFKEESTPRLIVWAESSSGFGNDPGLNSKTLEEISYEAKRLNASFLIGGDRPVDKNYFENYGIFINENGEITGEYLKQHPVPFGEYIPFRRYLDWIPPLSLVPRDMIRGDGQEIFVLGENNIKVSSVISFEGSFERYIRRSVQDGAELIVILTNQASYGESGMSDQFILMSRANAVSNHRDIVHAAITGKSAFINGVDGKVDSYTELFTDDISNSLLTAYSSKTTYSTLGNYLNYLIIVLGLFSFLYFRFINR